MFNCFISNISRRQAPFIGEYVQDSGNYHQGPREKLRLFLTPILWGELETSLKIHSQSPSSGRYVLTGALVSPSSRLWNARFFQ